ncbi:hypothetical protein BSL78_13150 [Apostichopus japonicus]|uniref:Ig-like domain-containing protein n=1 Tax=Stichopus japonicus TaxID=307972 RepID=A0A2G8KPK4_STIJA|nr:hypothetical protein BSL78_13150 [Apostichopus japonicus]
MKSLNASYETWFLLLIAFDTFIGVKMACQSTYQIEKGNNATIGCSPTEVPTEVFWYNGSPSSTNPILVLANDQKSGTLYDNIRFDINLDGEMLISNAQFEDEGKYTVVTYFSPENFHEEQITRQITVHPQQECPKISGCSSCSTCGLRVNQTGELICKVNGSRPQISLQWEISNINSLQFTTKEPISQDISGTWDTYISAEYTVSACGGFAEIRCLSQGDVNLMQRSDSNIEIKADPCPSDNVVADYSSTVLPSASETSNDGEFEENYSATTFKKTLTELIMDDLATNCNLKTKDVYTSLLNEPVIVLIDGFSELYLGDICGNVSAYVRELLNRTFPCQTEISENKVNDENTIRKGRNEMQQLDGDGSEICEAITTAIKQMRVWLSLRQTDGICQTAASLRQLSLANLKRKKLQNYQKEFTTIIVAVEIPIVKRVTLG